MAKLLQTLIPNLFLLLAAAATAQSQVPPSSTSFYYEFCGRAPTTGLTLQGDAHIPARSTFLRLTGANKTAVGRVVYTHPVQFWQTGGQVDFETTFTFLITPEAGRSPGDGIVFFIDAVGSTPPDGSDSGKFGVFQRPGDGSTAFAAELDTFVDSWDPDYGHIGIDLGSPVSKVTSWGGDFLVGNQGTATVTYKAATKVISIAVSAGIFTFEVEYEHDLSGFLPQQVQVGLSASTGEGVAAHDIHSWHFASTMVDTGAPSKSRKRLIRPFV